MESLAEVREDLRDIRYYYAHKEMFDKTVKVTGEHELIRKTERYNAAMCTAPPRLYEVYVGFQQLFRLIVAWCDFCKLLQQGAFLQLFLSFRKLGYFTLINLNFLLQPPDI